MLVKGWCLAWRITLTGNFLGASASPSNLFGAVDYGAAYFLPVLIIDRQAETCFRLAISERQSAFRPARAPSAPTAVQTGCTDRRRVRAVEARLACL